MAEAPEWARLTDQEVVLLARGGREAAYRELVRRYERPVFALLYRMVRDRELAEDLAQETFVKALNAIDSYRPEFKFSSWIFKIANNAAIDHLRRRELDRLAGAVRREGVTLVPLQLYFTPRGWAKVELGLARGKKAHDKRESIKERDWQREKQRLMRHAGR